MELTTDTAVRALTALAQPSRLEVVRLLVRALPGGLSAGRIATELGIPANTLSFHLAHLNQAGLVNCETRGRRRLYRADCQRVEALVAYLTRSCCAGVPTRVAQAEETV